MYQPPIQKPFVLVNSLYSSYLKHFARFRHNLVIVRNKFTWTRISIDDIFKCVSSSDAAQGPGDNWSPEVSEAWRANAVELYVRLLPPPFRDQLVHRQ